MLISFDKLFKKYDLKINGISHFGAHLGKEAFVYKNLDIKNIHLFEPQKNIFKKLEEQFLNDKEISLYNFGLGSENKTVNMNLSPDNEGMSASILNPEKHKKLYPEIKFKGTEKIKIKTYDELPIYNVNFLNIDIQGYEMHALKGSVDALKKSIDYILIEVNREELYEGSALVNELDVFLKKYNFIRVETKWVNRYIPWGDALFIKKEFVSIQRVLISAILKFLEKFSFYFLIIDTKRAFGRFRAKLKRIIKKLIIK